MRNRHRAFVSLSLTAAAAVIVLGVRAERRAVSADLAAPWDLHGAAYVGSATCRACHQEHYASWARTFHRTMTTEATEENVRGDFSGATLAHAGVSAWMDRDEGGGYRMTFSAPEKPARVAKVVRAVGSRRYQQYLASEGGALWRLPVAFDLVDRRWFPMTAAFLFADDSSPGADPARPVFGGGVFDRHVTRWNDNCVFCHNVGANPGWEPGSGRFETSVAELGVACEACHGPGGEHARRNADPVRRYALHLGGAADPTIVNPSRLSPARAADVCGRCHGQRIADDVGPFLRHGDPFVAGDDLALYSAPLWRDTALAGDRAAFAARFWADGTPRLTAYEYQGMLESRCASAGGLTCSHCHGMHEGDPRGQIRARFAGDGPRSDGMCTGCHAALAAPAALRVHGRHDPAGAGARCVSCHMPRIVYGVLDVHRSHRIEIPNPARAEADGRPDACSGCHVDGPSNAPQAPMNAVFAGDAVGRAVAADALGRGLPARPRRLGTLLEILDSDRYPAVRHIAWRSLRRLAHVTADYDPSGDPPARARAVAALRAELGGAAEAPAAAMVAALRATASDRDLEIGE